MLTSSLVRVRTVPPRPTLPTAVYSARDRLAQRVLDSIGRGGAILGDCESRVLESALALCLMQRLDMHPAAQERARGYLLGQWREGQLDSFHHALTASVLGLDAELSPAAAIEAYLADFEHFTSQRKRLFFTIVLAAVSGERIELRVRADQFQTGEEHQSWVKVMMHALKVLFFASRGQLEALEQRDIDALLLTTSRGETWEQYLLAHLLALLALDHLEGYEHVVSRCVEDLLAQQRHDGGFAFITSMEIFATATAGLGLVGAGYGGPQLHGVGDYLAGQQQWNGGWGYAQGVRQTDVDDTAYCVEFLRALDAKRYRGTISRAERYMITMQNPDGGFPTFQRGSDSEVAMTAAVLNALAPSRQRYRQVFQRGVRFIVDNQQQNGTFERSWSNAHANAIFRALLAMQTLNADMSVSEQAAAERRAMSYLRLSQNEDGGWGHGFGDHSDPISSAYALITLSHFDAEYTLGKGVEYLVGCQQGNGGYLSKPDQSGPRPIAYDVPVLADNFALIALDHIVSTHPAT